MTGLPEICGEQLTVVVEALEKRWPKAAQLLTTADGDILASMAFPQDHWTRIYSTNPLERLNREIRLRTDVVGVFPSQESIRKLTAPESLLDGQARPMRLPPVH